MSKRNLNVLVSGSGIAGSVFAYWILRAYPKANVTIVGELFCFELIEISDLFSLEEDILMIRSAERDPALRPGGASVDIRNAAVDIIKKMGTEQIIRDNCTQEAGMSYVITLPVSSTICTYAWRLIPYIHEN